MRTLEVGRRIWRPIPAPFLFPEKSRSTGLARFLLLWLSIAPWLTACANDPKSMKPPLEIPFALDKGGETIEFELRIVEKQTYTFGLSFGVNHKDLSDYDRVLKLAGDFTRHKDGTYVDLGEPLRVGLKIDSVENTVLPFSFEKTTSEIVRYALREGAYDKMIANIRLEPGRYKVRVENKLAAPAIHGTPINFHIRRAYLGK